MTYFELAKSCMPNTTNENRDIIETAQKMLYELIHGSTLMNAPIDVSHEACSDAFKSIVPMFERVIHLLPNNPLKDAPEFWHEDNSTIFSHQKLLPLKGPNGKPSDNIKIFKVEHHVQTIAGVPGSVYRFNGDSRLAIMLYSNSVTDITLKDSTEAEDPEAMKHGENPPFRVNSNFSLFSFINKVEGFLVPFPLVTTVIHSKDAEGVPLIQVITSDIRDAEIINTTTMNGTDKTAIPFLNPIGTNAVLEDTDWIPEDWFPVKSKDKHHHKPKHDHHHKDKDKDKNDKCECECGGDCSCKDDDSKCQCGDDCNCKKDKEESTEPPIPSFEELREIIKIRLIGGEEEEKEYTYELLEDCYDMYPTGDPYVIDVDIYYGKYITEAEIPDTKQGTVPGFNAYTGEEFVSWNCEETIMLKYIDGKWCIVNSHELDDNYGQIMETADFYLTVYHPEEWGEEEEDDDNDDNDGKPDPSGPRDPDDDEGPPTFTDDL